jgi:hypothetical protein
VRCGALLTRHARRRAGLRAALAALAVSCSAVQADDRHEQRAGYIECGSVQVRALAECLEQSRWCMNETLSFSRRAGRVIVPTHAKYSERRTAEKKIRAADYVAQSWACMPGKSGGHYLVVVMTRADGRCTECEYSRLYDLNGRLVATDFTFDTSGQARPNVEGREMMRGVLGGPGQHRFQTVYR